MTTDTDIRIYVASLSDYNAGRLHGSWIDATQEPDEIHAEIQAMLKASPEFKAFPQGGPAEEWAIHDYEGFGGFKIEEYEDIERVSKIAQAIEEHGEAMIAWLTISDDEDPDDFEAHYRGKWDSERAFAESTVDQIGWGNVPPRLYVEQYGDKTINVFDELSSIIDWDEIASGLFRFGGYSSADAGAGMVHVFEDEV